MGLDLICRWRSIRMGSYGYVHVQRWGWIRANMLLSVESAKDDEKQEIQERWERALRSSSPTSPKLDYDYIYEELRSDMLPGIFTFVYHSDSDGSWSCDEAKSMLDAFETLRSYIPRIEELAEEIDQDTGKYFLEDLFAYAWEKKSPIEFA